jgi:superfamily II DNA/RNA helicase
MLLPLYEILMSFAAAFPQNGFRQTFSVLGNNNVLMAKQKESSSSSSLSSSSSASLQYDATLSNQTFQELYGNVLPPWLLENCLEYGYERPTLIQQRTLDLFFGYNNDDEKGEKSNHDDGHFSSEFPTTADLPNSMVIQAQTGSGKSLCYLLPVLTKLQNRAAVQAVIIVPTRELGLQVASLAKRLAGRRYMVMSLLQGSQLRRQRAWAWAETPQVVIGTPNEVLGMIQYGGIPRISSIRTVVVDEVDACLVHNSGVRLQGSASKGGIGDSMALSSSLHQLLSKHLSPTYADELDDLDIYDSGASNLVQDASSNKSGGRKIQHRQTLFCSATIPQHRHFLKQCKANQWTLEEPVFVCTSPGEALPPTLRHGYMMCNSKEHKLATLQRIVKKLISPTNKILIFCDPVRDLEEIGGVLAESVENAVLFIEGKSQIEDVQCIPVVSVLRFEDSLSQRSAATKVFADGNSNDFRVLVTTDLAARGLDVLGITHVVHYDLPPDADAYLHRSGRTGRFGQRGQVVSIVTPDQEFVLRRLSNVLNVHVKCVGRQKMERK